MTPIMKSRTQYYSSRNLVHVTPAHADSSLSDFSTLKMEVILSYETSFHTRTTRRHIPEDGILHSHRRENLKSYVIRSAVQNDKFRIVRVTEGWTCKSLSCPSYADGISVNSEYPKRATSKLASNRSNLALCILHEYPACSPRIGEHQLTNVPDS
jgi:hypothetical protein